MTSNRPYLIRALYEWLVDNGLTPYLLVDARAEQARVPMDYAEDGRIVLNVTPTAVRDLQMGNDWISFSARFGGRAHEIMLPLPAVLGIYARENGQGMLFPEESAAATPDSPGQDPDDRPPAPTRPSLRVVK